MLFLRPSAHSKETWRWYHHSRDGSIDEGETNNPHDDLIVYRQSNVTLLIPSRRVLFYHFTLAGKFTRPSLQALGWQLEKISLSEAESLHISLISKAKNAYFIAAIEREILDAWVKSINSWKLRVTRAIPDALALPVGSAVKIDNEWLVHQQAFIPFSVEESMLPDIWDREPVETEIQCYSPVPENLQGWQCKSEISGMALLSKGCHDSKVNLLTGAFRPAPIMTSARDSRLFIIVGSLLALSLLTEPAVKMLREKQEINNLSQQSTAIYHSLFPEKTLPADARKKLKELLSVEPVTLHKGVVPLIVSCQDILQKLPHGKVRHISWNKQDNQLVITLSATESELSEALSDIAVSNIDIKMKSEKPQQMILTLIRKTQ
jgi:general secretion pathway protein L